MGLFRKKSRGVTWHKAAKKWQSTLYLGLFDSAEEAQLAYQNAITKVDSNETSLVHEAK